MSSDETASELAKLRAELAALKETQQAAPAPSPPSAATAPDASASASASASAARDEVSAEINEAIGEEGEVKSQLHELAELLENEIRDLPTITCLAVFSVGILMGRLLR